jgi:hypothetical protein
MDQVTQQNAALVEEAAAAAQSMADQAQALGDAVAVFRIARTGLPSSRVIAGRTESRGAAPTARPAPHVRLAGPTTPRVGADRGTLIATDAGAADWQAF